MQKKIRLASLVTASVTGAFILFIGLLVAYGAWLNPGSNPPGGNVAAPINVGPFGQAKQGGLWIQKNDDLAFRVDGIIQNYTSLSVGSNKIFPSFGSAPNPASCNDQSHQGSMVSGPDGAHWDCVVDTSKDPFEWKWIKEGVRACRVFLQKGGNHDIAETILAPRNWDRLDCGNFAEHYLKLFPITNPGTSGDKMATVQLACLFDDATPHSYGPLTLISGSGIIPKLPSPNCGW